MSDAVPAIRLSVVICTYNRAHTIRETLQSLKELDVEGLDGEVIFIDNNSTDGTRATIEEFLPHAPLPARYVFERQQGVAHARNAGVDHATGDVIAFTDDDVLVDRLWLREIADAFASEDPAAIGGKILPKWQVPPPDWLIPALHTFLALLNHGDKPLRMDEPVLWTANLAIRRDVFRTMRFHVGLGRVGDKLYNGEDAALIQMLLDRGERVLYWPRAVVHHSIPAQRLTKAYFRKWHWDAGSMAAQLMPAHVSRSLFGVPYHFYRTTMKDIATWSHCALKRDKAAFLSELRLIRTAGFAATRVRRMLRRDREQPGMQSAVS
jgi:glycosyltransferase involved in cell wall biosynthesis